jgi:HlyD family secretion protein
MPLSSRSRNLGIISLIVVAGGGAAAFHHFRNPSAPPQPHYTISKVTRGDVSKVVMTTGQLAPLISVEVSTQISGLITQVKVDFNSPVKRGQVLALIDPSSYQQALAQAKANLRSAEATSALARLTVDRQRQLVGKKVVSQSDFDTAEAAFEQSQALLLTQQAAVQNAQLDLDRCTITSPIDGVVIFKAADVGKTVQASFSAPTLFVIAQDLRKMQIIAPISEVDIWAVKPGQEVTFTVEALADRTFHGSLRQIRNPYTPSDKQANQTQAESSANSIATFDAVIEVDNPDLVLLPSLTATVSVVVDRHKNVLRLPNSALRVQLPPAPGAPPAPPGPPPPADAASPEAAPGTATVYCLANGDRNGTPAPTSVHLGLSDSIITEVASGLKEGDTVITGITRPPYQYRNSFF